jgi:ABC-type sugar transport system substrate-binding protein
MSTARCLSARAVAVAAVVGLVLTGCSLGRREGPSPPPAPDGAACPETFAAATAAVAKAEDTKAPWTGPTTGPRAASGKTIVYVAQTMTNPGVAGVAKGAEEAAAAIGWNLRAIDGEGTPAGIQAAFRQAIALEPDGIVIGGFDPALAAEQVRQANEVGIPLIGWHAVGPPGPSANPKLFTNITTNVAEVATISAQWIIKQSGGNAGVVVFTDESIPFAADKSELIKAGLATCAGVKVLSTEDIPIPDASTSTPRHVSALLARFGDSWTHSAAINDLYFADAAAALRAGGRQGGGFPFNLGAGDGAPSAFNRIRNRQYQAATVPEPLLEQGWQIVDEFNRAVAGERDSGFVPPIHLTTVANVGRATYWEPDNGYRGQYKKIWKG